MFPPHPQVPPPSSNIDTKTDNAEKVQSPKVDDTGNTQPPSDNSKDSDKDGVKKSGLKEDDSDSDDNQEKILGKKT